MISNKEFTVAATTQYTHIQHDNNTGPSSCDWWFKPQNLNSSPVLQAFYAMFSARKWDKKLRQKGVQKQRHMHLLDLISYCTFTVPKKYLDRNRPVLTLVATITNGSSDNWVSVSNGFITASVSCDHNRNAKTCQRMNDQVMVMSYQLISTSFIVGRMAIFSLFTCRTQKQDSQWR